MGSLIEGGGVALPQLEGAEPHGEDECRSILNLCMTEPGVGKIDSVECGRLNIAVQAVGVEVFGDDAKLLAVAEGERRIGNAWRADEVDVLAGDGKDAESGEDEPARHGAGVVVAGDAGAACR